MLNDPSLLAFEPTEIIVSGYFKNEVRLLVGRVNLIVILIWESDWYLEQLHEAHFHSWPVPESIVAQKEIKARLEVRPLFENDLVVRSSLDKLSHLDKG